MKPRQDIVAIFSTFLKWEANQVAEWITSFALQRSMKTHLQEDPQNQAEDFWALYWHHCWQLQTNPFAEAHLSAYLQETCYWVARKMALGFVDRSSIPDFFQIAIANLPRLLKHFDSRYSRSLQGYAELVFRNSLKDWLRIQQKVEVCSDWSLLYRLSRKRLTQALESAALNQLTIQQYVLAWECFRELVAVDNSATNFSKCPDGKTWSAIAEAYNANRMSQVSPAAQICSPQQVEQWLIQCAQLVRQYLNPKVISVDAPVKGQEFSNFIDTIPDETQDSPLEILLDREEQMVRQRQIAEISQVLAASLAELDAESSKLLQAYYSQDLTQTEIAIQFGIKQFQVSRRLERIRRSLLKKVVHWSQETLHISPTPEVVDAMSLTLEEWLNQAMPQVGELRE